MSLEERPYPPLRHVPPPLPGLRVRCKLFSTRLEEREDVFKGVQTLTELRQELLAKQAA